MRVLVVGSGRTVGFLARRFLAKRFDVAVITPDAGEARRLARELPARVLLGDGTSPLLLRDADADASDALVALTPRDEDNLVACQIARRMYGVPHLVALVNDPANVELFRRLGVASAFSITELLAGLIEQRTSVSDLVDLLPLADGRVQVTEVTLPEDAPAAGRSVIDLRLPAGALIVAVLRRDVLIVPSGSTTLAAGDRLVVVSQQIDHGPLLRILLGDE